MSSPTATHPVRAARIPRSWRPAVTDADGRPATSGRLDSPTDASASCLTLSAGRTLGRYESVRSGEHREILAVPVRAGGELVVDCRAPERSDPRLVGHIAADEPVGNAEVLCRLYLADAGRGVCRRVELQDIVAPPAPEPTPSALQRSECEHRPTRLAGFCIHALADRGAKRQLRWLQGDSGARPAEPVTLRNVVACLEAYEPATEITVATIRAHPIGCGISTATLRMELQRLRSSRVVLNRGLRDAVDRALTSGVSMSEIALRCGRTKRDCRGNVTGETSWLARRIGRMPEGGESRPTPWVHTSTLALIARDGLGLSPREVEL